MNTPSPSRREFLKQATRAAGAPLLSTSVLSVVAAERPSLFKISLAGWSVHRAYFSGKMTNFDFVKAAKQDYDIDAVEYVNHFFKDKADNRKYLAELKRLSDDVGVTNVLIMIDDEGHLGDPDDNLRTKAVQNHHQWVDAAKFLGCHSIRVNAHSDAKLSPEEQGKLATDGLRRLSEYGASQGINVIVENHGGISSNGKWLAKVIADVKLSNCGTLPDFGNFHTSATEEYDRYQGVAELMPFAKGVSAKSHNFDATGNETGTDYRKMMKIVLDAGYHGFVGIEYEGDKLSEPDGIRATKRLLEKVRAELA
ncbi:MAG: sugar phosphate isomerase/epimerase [Pirellulales bacterium]|nr:sugar phosphate isomerase/epimerase [Pirellulales bacterium]